MAVLHQECQGALVPGAFPPPFAEEKTRKAPGPVPLATWPPTWRLTVLAGYSPPLGLTAQPVKERSPMVSAPSRGWLSTNTTGQAWPQASGPCNLVCVGQLAEHERLVSKLLGWVCGQLDGSLQVTFISQEDALNVTGQQVLLTLPDPGQQAVEAGHLDLDALPIDVHHSFLEVYPDGGLGEVGEAAGAEAVGEAHLAHIGVVNLNDLEDAGMGQRPTIPCSCWRTWPPEMTISEAIPTTCPTQGLKRAETGRIIPPREHTWFHCATHFPEASGMVMYLCTSGPTAEMHTSCAPLLPAPKASSAVAAQRRNRIWLHAQPYPGFKI
ncbi:hypothetical protein H920_17580 [Fukomys damarensis]|uniref:Uncharacterized protein n=1 Tax=Fukomys damarensis TaxID=885580 RepID=A0A091CRZ4_FUKDA|nr:hypothetical protein H920_17580 [Fukomys damarensis]